jgi:leucyl/phenylalanyl-tRNA--protein transferase
MKQVLNRGTFEFRINTAFEQVINNCRNVYREGQGGTWIGDDVVDAYVALHKAGYACSAEAWHNGIMVGGLYGLWMGNAFFGESMFAHQSNASKFAFINWVQVLHQRGVQLIDCQVYTEHLESLGARMMSRNEFIAMVDELTNKPLS